MRMKFLMLHVCGVVQKVPLVSESRCLVKKGPLLQLCKPASMLRKNKRTLHFFLFNDLLFITKKKK